MGLFHGLHVLGIEAGSATNLNGGRFLSFAALDRFASAGNFGKEQMGSEQIGSDHIELPPKPSNAMSQRFA
jgi:hypothetical protein